MKVLDEGHKYQLSELDGGRGQQPVFVKRVDPKDPAKYPGNLDAYPGTTSQDVIKCLLNRARYVHNQIWAIENVFVIFGLRLALWFLEFRAARRHGRFYFKSLSFPENQIPCLICGHTNCKHEIKSKSS